MVSAAIPTVDLTPFFTAGDDAGKSEAKQVISEACSEYGFFQIVNHGVPLDLMKRAIDLSTEFYNLPKEEKLKSSPGSGAPLPAGYNKQPDHSVDKNEYLMMFPPESNFNVLPDNPPHFREVLEDVFRYLSKTGELIEEIVAECLGLPCNFLKEYNNDRSWDFMVAMNYFPATETENNGITEHEDGNCITFVIQDENGGLQVKKNGEWIPVIPTHGTIVVNISDVVQVLSNKKFKSATHRVVRPEGKNRYSYAFFYNLKGDKWVEPLPKFTTEISKLPKYRGFVYSEYMGMRMKNKTHPPATTQDIVTIDHYAIN